ncbi:hypothetical protein DKX38_001173 [Salix brachista]|uniref:Cupin type-1 domain-containing protein n=1 Tax=Salix brachista TaxID=2182728 RepID=A0A5N5P3D0_9ROSI|nr:hypothetical protein DKX38_001173 [Salix brachista]
MQTPTQPSVFLLLLLSLSSITAAPSDDGGFCSAPPSLFETETASSKPLYWRVTNPTLSPAHLQDLPGFTRSVYKRDHALLTPESHVFSPLPEWTNTLGAYLITPENSSSGLPPNDVERFLFVVQGSATLSNASGAHHQMTVDSYAYLPPNFEHSLECGTAATLVVFERSEDVEELPAAAKALESVVPNGIYDEVSCDDWADANEARFVSLLCPL